jgi:hypothetical protein
MSENLDMNDKILLAPGDSSALMDHFSRLNPGDEVEGSFKATLDEAGQKSIVMSITEIEIKNAGDIKINKSGDGDGDDGDDGDEPMGVKVMKNDEGVPENVDNMPSDIMPTH